MVTPTSASEFPFKEETINVPMLDCSIGGNPKCLDTSLNFFLINFCNIRRLKSNFQSVHRNAQMSETTDSSPFSVPS
ncbi:hypothetical protein E2C01_052405 [Portunus trituberculatus]|uniref:Uncharacterized protein n=1 Tax=Portunus trituberculatus TaxID=210409 RepID=A0A5B7GDL2_PORTR|nr:hypothetical protein [Portunus trituberculatus]